MNLSVFPGDVAMLTRKSLEIGGRGMRARVETADVPTVGSAA